MHVFCLKKDANLIPYNMNDPQISISYNGRKTAVTCLPDNTFLVQITSKPYYIRMLNSEDGLCRWVEVETDRTTPLASEIGGIIEKQSILQQ